jgi:hypothetical protein
VVFDSLPVARDIASVPSENSGFTVKYSNRLMLVESPAEEHVLSPLDAPG